MAVTMDDFPQEPPGLNLLRFRDFFESACPGEVSGPLRGRVMAGGKSNITYEVTDGASMWIVRRPPLGHVLPTAHDMAREFRVMSALYPTRVPVPRMYALCEDREVLGEPFFVMERVAGTPYRWRTELEGIGPERTAALSTRIVHGLSDLHDVDPGAVGLSDFGRPGGFLARQVRRWETQLRSSYSRDLAGADRLRSLLEANLPPEGSPSIVHGDYRLDNLLVDGDDRVAAVIDWEMATLGDPLTDVALMCVYQRLPEIPGGAVVSDATLAPGYIGLDDTLRVYADRSSRDTSNMAFYLGLAYFKLAAVLEGVHKRYVDGRTLGDGFDAVGEVVEPLLAEGIYAMREYH